MIQKHWKKIKISLTILTTMITFLLFLYVDVNTPPIMENNKIIVLPISGIPMPYWLLNGLAYILLPAFCTLIAYSILEKIEEKYVFRLFYKK